MPRKRCAQNLHGGNGPREARESAEESSVEELAQKKSPLFERVGTCFRKVN